SRNHYRGPQGGLFKSTDGGQTWRKLTQGLPADLQQIFPTVAPSDPRRLYAVVGVPAGGGIYRSDDAGETWTAATPDPRPALAIGGGDLPVLRVDPQNPDLVYSTTVVAWRSSDGAKTWSALKGAPGGDDYQNLWINPLHPEIMLFVSDQGAVVTLNRGRTWSSWYNQPTAQLYHVSADHAFPYRVYSGQQESGSVGIASRGNDGYISFRDWHPVGASEYGYVTPDPLDPNLVYGAGRLEVSRFHWDTGQVEAVTPVPLAAGELRAVRTQPIMFSPVDPHVLYYAANRLFATNDGGQTWRTLSPDLSRPHAGIPPSVGALPAKEAAEADKERGVIYALAPSPLDQAVIWAGTDDGLVWLTTDGGTKWLDVTPPGVTAWSKVTQIDASRFDRQNAYVAVSRFRVDDLTPYIYRTHDAGRTWQLITGGLPADAPVNTVRADPVRPGLLFAGSETAVWFSLDDGDHWRSLQLNLPHTSMRDLCLHDADLIVATHGRSFWILDDITPLRQIDAGATPATVTLFQPAPAVRVRNSVNTDTPLPPDEPVGENPPDGAIIDYLLPAPAVGPVTLEIFEAGGRLVRRFSDADAPEITAASLAKLTIPSYWVQRPPALATAAGLHRWVWDLHYTAPESLRHHYPIAAVPNRTPRLPAGPRALPGAYQVRLTVAGHTSTAPLLVTADPRLRLSAADLARNFQLQQQVAGIVDRSTRLLRQARSLLEQAGERFARAHGLLADRLSAFQKKVQAQLAAPAGAEFNLTGINNEALELYGRFDYSDAAPTAGQITDAEALAHELQELTEAWEKLLAAEVPALNAQLTAAGLAGLKPERPPDGPDEAQEADLD
ncbi:MAG: glycoside hydrolase, partial [bacterium]|nr:glycoside hydrolase [bacterium]